MLSRHVLSDGSRWPVSNGIRQALTNAGVTRVIVGHTPVGNCPSVIRSMPGERTPNPLASDMTYEGGLTVFMCDTSYSNLTKIAGGGPRGKAVSEVIVLNDTQTAVHGELETETAISYVIGGHGGDGHVGRDLNAGATKAAESSTVYVAARLAKASTSKAYVLQRRKGCTHEQWLVGDNLVEDRDDANETFEREQVPGKRRLCEPCKIV